MTRRNNLKNFALLGVGDVGSNVASAFANAGDQLVIVTRNASLPTIQSFVKRGLQVEEISAYDDEAALATIFRKHAIDGVISTVSPSAIGLAQANIAKAAKAAGVKLFVPSGFGGADYFQKSMDQLHPFFGNTKAFRDLLDDIKLPWADVANGSFAEYLLSPWNGIDFNSKIVTVPPESNAATASTTLEDIGRFVHHLVTTQTFASPDDPKPLGKTWIVEGFRTSLLDLLTKLGQIDPEYTLEQWTIQPLNIERLTQLSQERTLDGFRTFVMLHNLLNPPGESDNARLGFKPKTTSIEQVIPMLLELAKNGGPKH